MSDKTATKGEQTRQKIVEAAAAMFNQRGYEGSSLAVLMEATGLQKGGIYRHFSSKEELAAEAFDYTWKTAKDLRMRGLGRQETGIGSLKLFIENFVSIRSPVAGGCPILNAAVDADDGNPMLRERVSKALRWWVARLRFIVKRAARRSEIRPGVDPETVATLIIATLEGALMMSRLERSDVPLQRAQAHLYRYLDNEVAVPAA